jgi:hypothetical protein
LARSQIAGLKDLRPGLAFPDGGRGREAQRFDRVAAGLVIECGLGGRISSRSAKRSQGSNMDLWAVA